MKKKLFLGKPLHWLFILLLLPAGYAAGNAVLHASNFVTWASLLFSATFLLVLALWLTSSPGDQMTRDPYPGESDSDLRESAD